MSYDYREKKIIAILDEELSSGIAMNALGHMAFSAGHYSEESWMGKKELVDSFGEKHLGISKYPFIVLKAKKDEIKSIVKKAKQLGIFCIGYPKEMFDTGHDDELVLAIKTAKELLYFGCVLTGKTTELKELTGHLRLYK